MRQRLKQLGRVTGVRAIREKICEAASVRAAGELRLSEEALKQAECFRMAAITEGQGAITNGDLPAWLLADAMREVAEWDRVQLQKRCKEREAEFNEKLEIFRVSRRQREQGDRVVSSIRELLVHAEERKDQTLSDDRFGARLHWSNAQESLKSR